MSCLIYLNVKKKKRSLKGRRHPHFFAFVHEYINKNFEGSMIPVVPENGKLKTITDRVLLHKELGGRCV